MIRICHVITALITGLAAVALAPAAHADDTVTYEVTSSYIAAADVEYFDLSGRNTLEHVTLPWRTNATVSNAHSNDAELRAYWRPAAAPSKWVSVRIYSRGSLLCQSTFDIGNAVCYGNSTIGTF